MFVCEKGVLTSFHRFRSDMSGCVFDDRGVFGSRPGFSSFLLSVFLCVDPQPEPADDQRSNQPLPHRQLHHMVSSPDSVSLSSCRTSLTFSFLFSRSPGSEHQVLHPWVTINLVVALLVGLAWILMATRPEADYTEGQRESIHRQNRFSKHISELRLKTHSTICDRT